MSLSAELRILVVSADPALSRLLPKILQSTLAAVNEADSAEIALGQIAARQYDAIVTDINLPRMDRLVLLGEIQTRHPTTPVFLIGHRDQELVIHAIRGGAYDFIQKPIQEDYFVALLRHAIEMGRLGCRNKDKEHRDQGAGCTLASERTIRATDGPLRMIYGGGRQMDRVIAEIKQVADSPLSVIIEGETGTGKELVARAIHHVSARRKKPFVAVDCGAIPDTLTESEFFGHDRGAFTGAFQQKEGRFQLAQGGSLFLDEVVNIPLHTQTKLLRVLQERGVQPLGCNQLVQLDVRIIAASNVPLIQEVRSARFRKDLYFRLNEFVITLPPLRERDDVLNLAKGFMEEACIEFAHPCCEISQEAADLLCGHRWPGNVRELRNVMRRAVLVASDFIEPKHISLCATDPTFGFVDLEPSYAVASSRASPIESPSNISSLKQIAHAAAAEAEQKAIRWALTVSMGNKSGASRLLRTDYKTFHLKMKRYGVDVRRYRETPLLT